MKASDIIRALEQVAPLRYQDDFDNSGLQVGFADAEVKSIMVCLDITEKVVEEAVERGCEMMVSHHPLLFHPLRQVSDITYQQRCVTRALAAGITIYSAHTSLDNAPGGVNHRMASVIGLENLEWLSPKVGMDAGSGLVGMMKEPMEDFDFIDLLAERFEVECLPHTKLCGKTISKVALCGGAGAFLLRDAVRSGADCFITGELHYHDYFENDGLLLAALGHYQSESHTIELLKEVVLNACPDARVLKPSLTTNPVLFSNYIY